MELRTDIDPENTWVWSDTHFHHSNIAAYCHRPEDHDQIILAEARKEVPEDATLLHLGDLNYGSNSRFRHLIAKEIPGARKLLIQGNHDAQRFSFYKQSGFQIVKPFFIEYGYFETRLVRTQDSVSAQSIPYRIEFSHYPSDSCIRDGSVRIHGHIHNNGYTRDAFVPFAKNHINLSVEQTKYKPVNLKLLLEAYLYGRYPRTTEEQLEEARKKRTEVRAEKEAQAYVR